MRKDLQEHLLQRLRSAEKQLRGVALLVHEDEDRPELLRQIKTVHDALGQVSQRILVEHLTVCVAERLGNRDPIAHRQAMRELTALLTFFGAGKAGFLERAADVREGDLSAVNQDDNRGELR
jgi:DNA-binding FrmR family transcriptional regulator